MANTIIHKRSSVAGKVPLTSDLEYGELAVNTADSKVFIKDASNVVKAINSWAAVHDKPSGLTTAVSTNTANTIPLRDASGNFAAGTITANLTGNVTGALTGNASTATALETARLIAGKSFDGSADVVLSQLTRGSYLTGTSYNGSTATTWAVDATSANTASKVVARDASGNFAAGTITAKLTGNVTGSASNNVLKAGDTMTGFLTLHADPSNALHAVTKQYVDRLEQGLKAKPAAKTATTANLPATYNNGAAGTGATLTIAAAATLTIGGVSTWSVNDGVLVKNQTNAFENGRYNITQVGNASTPWILTRCALCDNANEIPGAYTFITAGTYKGTGWVQTVDNPSTFTVGTDPIAVVQFAGAGEYVGGTGISVVENSISLANAPATTNTANTLVLRDATGNFSAGTITAALAGNASSADKWSTARTITLNGDLTGSVSIDGSANATLTATVAANSVALGTDTTGNYVAGATAGNYILVSGTAGEGWSPTIAVDATSANTASKVVARDASGNFSAGTITAALAGNASTASTLATARTISLTGDVTGSTSFDGSGNASIAAVIADNSHNHTIANVDGLQTALDGKAAASHEHTVVRTNDTRAVNINPWDYAGASIHLKSNTTDGLADGGMYHAVFNLAQWKDASGGKAHQLGFTENDSIWHRSVASGPTFGSWRKIYTTANSATANTANTLVLRDGSGNFSAGTITASLSGNASTATTLQTARTISLTGDVTGSTSFDGSGNVSIAAVIADNSHNHTIANVDGLQTALDGKQAALGFTPVQQGGGTGQGTNKVYIGWAADASGLMAQVDATNFGISWPINITKNAATATKLATARTINGVGFDGSANITVADATKLPLTGGTLTGPLHAPTSRFVGSANGYSTGGIMVDGGGSGSTVYPTVGFHQPGLYGATIQCRGGDTFGFYDIHGVNLVNVYAANFIGTASAAKYADLAENYVADAAYEPGTVLEFGGDQEVTLNTQALTHRVAGVVSTNPAYLMNSECAAEHVAAIALQGRVPCRVTGTVRKGDLLVAAGNGAARAWDFRTNGDNPPTGSVIGKALENNNQAEAIIEVVVGVR